MRALQSPGHGKAKSDLRSGLVILAKEKQEDGAVDRYPHEWALAVYHLGYACTIEYAFACTIEYAFACTIEYAGSDLQVPPGLPQMTRMY